MPQDAVSVMADVQYSKCVGNLLHIFLLESLMKQLLFRLLVGIAAAAFTSSVYAQASSQAMDRLRILFPGAKIKQSVGGLLEVDTRVYASQDGRTVLVGGRVIDAVFLLGGAFPINAAKAMQPESRVPARRTAEFAKLPLNLAINIVKGDGARKLALFTDVDCPFCKQIEKTFESVSDVSIYVFLLPVDKLHPDARRKSESIWCALDKPAAWKDYWGSGRLVDAKCPTPFPAIAALAEELGINGTPTLIRASDGAILPGALQKEQLEAWLSGK
jgi:thiol:disulfide interchange protein DsbC